MKHNKQVMAYLIACYSTSRAGIFAMMKCYAEHMNKQLQAENDELLSQLAEYKSQSVVRSNYDEMD